MKSTASLSRHSVISTAQDNVFALQPQPRELRKAVAYAKIRGETRLSAPLDDAVYKMVSQQYRHGLVVHLGEFGAAFTIASIKKTETPPRGQAFSG